jgi:hypothetical protein
MIHPNTTIRYINDEIGYGVFATQFLPKGTIVYVKDELEVEVSPEQYQQLPPTLRQTVDKYSFIDENGYRIVSWDFAKYVNHCCNCNTMSTGYGFEIAIRDIQAGEEITDEYGMFNMESEMYVQCKFENCRGRIRASDIDSYHAQWDELVFAAMLDLGKIDQDLLPILSPETRQELEAFRLDPTRYKSVTSLKWAGAVHQWNGKG